MAEFCNFAALIENFQQITFRFLNSNPVQSSTLNIHAKYKDDDDGSM